jgi:hypothetical protein
MNGRSIYFDNIPESYVTNKMIEQIMELVKILVQ